MKLDVTPAYADGKPAKATEVSLGIVDESIYAVRPEQAPDIRKFFYSKRANTVLTYSSFPEEYSGGPNKIEPRVRKDFRDTAAWLPVLFSLSVLTWVAGFDIIYALQDEAFDRSQKLHSIPAAIGISNALIVSILLHVCSAVFVVAAGFVGHFNLIYWTGALFYAAMLTYQHLLVKPSDLSKVNIAFANTNGLASVVFAIFTIISLLVY